MRKSEIAKSNYILKKITNGIPYGTEISEDNSTRIFIVYKCNQTLSFIKNKNKICENELAAQRVNLRDAVINLNVSKSRTKRLNKNK